MLEIMYIVCPNKITGDYLFINHLIIKGTSDIEVCFDMILFRKSQ